MRSPHKSELYKRHLRYWPLILLAWDSRRLLKDFMGSCQTSQKTLSGFIPTNCPPGDRRRYTSQREGSFDSLGFVKRKLLMLKRIMSCAEPPIWKKDAGTLTVSKRDRVADSSPLVILAKLGPARSMTKGGR